jgi:hypothetical protein
MPILVRKRIRGQQIWQNWIISVSMTRVRSTIREIVAAQIQESVEVDLIIAILETAS